MFKLLYSIQLTICKCGCIHIVNSFRMKLIVGLIEYCTWFVILQVYISGDICDSYSTFIMTVAIFVRSLMLPGSVDGIYFFFYPEFDKILKARVTEYTFII